MAGDAAGDRVGRAVAVTCRLGPFVVGPIVYCWFIARQNVVIAGRRYWFLTDDAMISMRYARNLAHGRGLLWNAGQRPVQGYTNLLWTLVLAAVHLLPISDRVTSLAVMALGAAIVVATVALAGDLAAELGSGSRGLAAPVARWLVALCYPLVFWSLVGMEAGLVTLVLLAAVRWSVRWVQTGRPADLAIVAGALTLAVLARTDDLLPCLIIVVFCVALAAPGARWLVGAGLVGPLVVVAAGSAGFGLTYYGHALPNTYYLKVTGHSLSVRVGRGLRDLTAAGVARLGIPVVIAAGYLWPGRERRHPGVMLLLALFATQCTYSVYVGGDAYDGSEGGSHILAVAVPALLIVAAIVVAGLFEARPGPPQGRVAAMAGGVLIVGVLRALDYLPGRPGRLATESLPLSWAIGAPALVLGVLAVAQYRRRAGGPAGRPIPAVWWPAVIALVVVAVSGEDLAGWYHHGTGVAGLEQGWVRVAVAVRAASRPTARVATAEAGVMSYYSDRPMIDLLGYSDDVVARQRPTLPVFIPAHDKADLAYSVGRLRPDVIALTWPLVSPADQIEIISFGYDELSPEFYLRTDSPSIDRGALEPLLLAAARAGPS